jgi:hypothetical protein
MGYTVMSTRGSSTSIGAPPRTPDKDGGSGDAAAPMAVTPHPPSGPRPPAGPRRIEVAAKGVRPQPRTPRLGSPRAEGSAPQLGLLQVDGGWAA